ncbi:hypothetical protein D3C71_2217830 [compost metagenome]
MAMAVVSFFPLPSGSLSRKALATSTNSSAVVGIFKPNLSSQSWRIQIMVAA